jgi:phosphoribosyl 1,2-cyclic phosphodiesterase
MRVWLLGSGSTGNVAIVEAAGARLMIDAGLGPRAAVARMRELGGDLAAGDLDGLVVTHHHGDHIGHAMSLARAFRAPLYLHRGVSAPRLRAALDVREYVPGVTLPIGPFELRAQWVPHDAPQVALSVAAGGRRVGIATDVGHVTRGLVNLLADCDGALLEANHCRAMLAEGPYPPRVQGRIGGDYGHLANVEAAALASQLIGSQIARLWLCHLSRFNNTPRRALDEVLPKARGIVVEAIGDGVSRLLEVPVGRRTRMTQLSLGFHEEVRTATG